ncbi:hypothetical protein IAI10_02190 [Clostridium sp. 19966]|uniref:hypothetical protein n=1 Tax=Clostridium sp. 19966 TaxID=2768166 RepID=UPI0028DE7D58|nr:hypothetical protein [Clostridium sp. 19966]MDT8715467.1 hypothetical protein [Clostridium sp. 19966]
MLKDLFKILNLSNEDKMEIIKIVQDDVKVNHIMFGKTTSIEEIYNLVIRTIVVMNKAYCMNVSIGILEDVEIVSSERASKIIETRAPTGLFLVVLKNGRYTAIDNTTKDAWIEEFMDLKKCLKWLQGYDLEDLEVM